MFGLSKPVRGALVGLSLLVPSDPDSHAVTVVDYAPGAGIGIFLSDLALGPPRGAGPSQGSLHVTSLGVGGSLTLGFDVELVDGPGADFAVFENGFFGPGLVGVHAEVAFVEVSSDGTTFARFRTSYAGPAGPLSPFATTPLGSYSGFAGGRPVLAHADQNAIDPTDLTAAGGTGFDLADLRRSAPVLSGQVDLSAIRYVRLVDVVDGELDSQGVAIHDNSGPGGSADIDAVTLLNHADNQDPGRPTVELEIDGSGRLHVLVEDPDGLLDIASLSSTVALQSFDLFAFLGQFTLVETTESRMHLTTTHAVAGSGVTTDLSVTVRDASGLACSDQVTIQG